MLIQDHCLKLLQLHQLCPATTCQFSLFSHTNFERTLLYCEPSIVDQISKGCVWSQGNDCIRMTNVFVADYPIVQIEQSCRKNKL